ncbi:hypothetical protein MTO96_008414 [Rhipicephalus appendiculatus]
MALSGRLALVTGGASGIGKAICQNLASEGATVVVADKQLEEATKVAESLSAENDDGGDDDEIADVRQMKGGAKHHALYVDVGDSSSVEQLFSCMRSTSTLPLAIVVNSAGIYIRASLVDTSDEMFDETIRVHLRGTFLVTRAAAREMTRSENVLPEGGAAIVNISSVGAKTGWPLAAAYCAAKAGVVALTKSAAQELAAHGIRCNALLPGLTMTPMTDPLSRGKQGRGSVIDSA